MLSPALPRQALPFQLFRSKLFQDILDAKSPTFYPGIRVLAKSAIAAPRSSAASTHTEASVALHFTYLVK